LKIESSATTGKSAPTGQSRDLGILVVVTTDNTELAKRRGCYGGLQSWHNVIVNTTEAALALGGINPDFVLRLIRCGQLPATKVNGRWDISESAVEARRKRLAAKRSSRSHVERQREERSARARARFTPRAGLPGGASS
jgi:hypothetical protein